jgi:hypothetical protein
MKTMEQKLTNLNIHIFDIRNALNKVCITQEKEARLIISKCLDDLILEYMKVQNRKRLTRNWASKSLTDIN